MVNKVQLEEGFSAELALADGSWRSHKKYIRGFANQPQMNYGCLAFSSFSPDFAVKP